jgi:hypothetical protein
MPPSPNLFSPDNSQGSVSHSSSAPPWLVRAEFFLRVMVRLYVGVVVLALPWTHFWTDNRLLLYYAPLAKIAFSGITRGLVSGLGILNAWIALSEAIHHHER